MPARKRQRLSTGSSPVYEGDVLNLSQEDLRAMDELEAKLSQPSSPSHRKSMSGWLHRERSPWREEVPGGGARTGEMGGAQSQGESIGILGEPSSVRSLFQTASTVHPESDDASEAPPVDNYSAWFEPGSPSAVASFHTAKSLVVESIESTETAEEVPFIGFKMTSDKGIVMPSAAALAAARDKMGEIWRDDYDENTSPAGASTPQVTQPPSAPSPAFSPERPALRARQNQYSPGTPSPSGIAPAGSLGPSAGKGTAKAFQPPLLKPPPHQAQTAASHMNSPLNPNAKRSGFQSAAHASSQHSQPQPQALPHTPASLPYKVPTSSMFTTPVRLGAGTPVRRHAPAPFKTPFKAGVRPPQASSQMTPKATPQPLARVKAVAGPSSPAVSTPKKVPQTPVKSSFFNLTKPPNRHTLASSGLHPQSYSLDDLRTLGIDPTELSAMTPTLAPFYTFHTSSDTPALLTTQATQITRLGPSAAFDQLIERGCTLATKLWVENHWCLILWKLAGMVALEPEKEGDPETKRWCWKEVMRQMVYRYERELNGGSRPPLRLIATQDAPASCPMVLCVSNITWSEAAVREDGTSAEPCPELEVTDGWYRLRARVDEPLARAIRAGTIRVGRKLAVAGARLSSERKDPMEILEAYNSVQLVLSGNSSHLAPWHAKLGFQRGPFVSTLNSLTHDGGVVSVMDVVVIKMYPIAYIEFLENEAGEKSREGPRTESQEAAVMEKWKRRREVEASKLREELEKRLSRYESYAERMEHKAGPHFRPGEDDGPSDRVENLYDALEDPATASATLSTVRASDAGWFARVIRERIGKEREAATDEMERELDSICPPRNVRNFRVLEVQDTCTRRRPANRTAQLTAWDVLKLTFSEGGEAGSFQVGQRFQVTNLVPSQRSAWMDLEPGSMVYLSTRNDTRWTKLKATQQSM
ncbi:hypothetical protein PC9H_003304 [Pleurotus ostreatus]|uniref:BRCA2 OB1 domain-containing protein n=1 Tax=Pleurotus ostreatus TaxID=5322 RepID=A0A8H7A296_PLEOS|nr:uncharacterized protein PC9H_003304 [Pleurotus ostreatus]KAF7436471.1 hypothetical protein PC9H_003304 [Pleurotus ostreatus]